MGGVRPGQGRPCNPVKQEYKEDPQEYFRKASAKHRGQEIPVETKKSPKEVEPPKSRGRPSNSPSGNQSPATKRANAQQGMKRKRMGDKRRRCVSKRKDRQSGSKKESDDEESSEEESSHEEKGKISHVMKR